MELVVLLHGLGGTPRSMRRMEEELAGRGYRVRNLAYPSREMPIEALADLLRRRLEALCGNHPDRLHFVTHSMGGILLRYCLSRWRPHALGRVVMLGPPNGGTELVDLLRRFPAVARRAGPARLQLGTDPSSVPSLLGPVDYELGVIAGNRSLNPLYSLFLPGENDGRVSVERARVHGMSDFLVVPCSHIFIMRSRRVIEQAAHFLEQGAFLRAEPA